MTSEDSNPWQRSIPPALVGALDDAIERLGPLPILHGTFTRVLELAEDPQSSTGDLVAALERDEAFAANLLRLANCAQYPRRIRARSVRQAVTLVGRRAVRRLCLDVATYRFLELAPGNGRVSRGQMHVHAVSVAACAHAIAEKAGLPGDDAHLAGLLHDFGKLLMPAVFGEDALDEVALEHPSGRARADAERARFGIDHADAGALFVARAGLPPAVCAAVAQHHRLPDAGRSLGPATACVQLADAVVAIVAGQPIDEQVIRAQLDALGLDLDVLDELADQAVPGEPPPRVGDVAQRVAELERLSQVDDLTELATRRHWLHTVRARLAEHPQGALLLCDVDRFKEVNDQWGHRAGDLVLTDVARVVDRHGFAGRLGGDEFVVWLSAPPDQAEAVAREIVDEIDELFAGDANPAGPVGVSIGVACAPRDGQDLPSLLELADSALYAAKGSGGRRARRAESADTGPPGLAVTGERRFR